jgi:hypothetical protein
MSASHLISEEHSLSMAVTRTVLPAVTESAIAVAQVGMGALRWPFDAARVQYALGVQTGLFKRSILASRDVEGVLGALERLSLGPLARHQ